MELSGDHAVEAFIHATEVILLGAVVAGIGNIASLWSVSPVHLRLAILVGATGWIVEESYRIRTNRAEFSRFERIGSYLTLTGVLVLILSAVYPHQFMMLFGSGVALFAAGTAALMICVASELETSPNPAGSDATVPDDPMAILDRHGDDDSGGDADGD